MFFTWIQHSWHHHFIPANLVCLTAVAQLAASLLTRICIQTQFAYKLVLLLLDEIVFAILNSIQLSFRSRPALISGLFSLEHRRHHFSTSTNLVFSVVDFFKWLQIALFGRHRPNTQSNLFSWRLFRHFLFYALIFDCISKRQIVKPNARIIVLIILYIRAYFDLSLSLVWSHLASSACSTLSDIRFDRIAFSSKSHLYGLSSRIVRQTNRRVTERLSGRIGRLRLTCKLKHTTTIRDGRWHSFLAIMGTIEKETASGSNRLPGTTVFPPPKSKFNAKLPLISN